MQYQITPYEDKYQQQIIDLILPIQQLEFNVPITVADQPDLKNIPEVYQHDNGNFWVAVRETKVVGSIALIDIGNQQAALRKMFVHQDHRGKEKGVAQLLMNTLLAWCRAKKVKHIFLGTIDNMHAAHRFYIRNNFTEIPKTDLPKNFPVMRVDNRFFECRL